MKIINRYLIERKVIQYFSVEASSKEEALTDCMDMYNQKILSEKIKLEDKHIREEDDEGKIL
jgi:hypothetical protein